MSPTKVIVDETSPMRNAITGVLVAIFAASLGFGVSQATLAVDVKTHTIELQHLKETDTRIFNDLADEKSLIREFIKQNQEFINLLRVQNELLMQKRP